MAIILAVSNRKGGTGKTTVSVNIAAELAARGQRILLIDLDSQGHCAVGLGISVTRETPYAHAIFLDEGKRLAQAVVPTAYKNLSLVPADPMFDHGFGLRDTHVLARALKQDDIDKAFDIVILDTPPSLDTLLLNALIASHWVLVPFVPHPLSFEAVKQLSRLLYQVMCGPNQGLKIAGFLPMMIADHIRQHRITSADLVQQFGAHRMLPGIRSDIRLAECFGVGKPIRTYAPKSRAAEDFARLGDIMVQISSNFTS